MSGISSFRPATISVLVCGLIAVGGSVCYAQGNPPPKNGASNKRACDFITPSDAESILGTTVEAMGADSNECWFTETGWTNNPPKNKSVRFSVWYWPTPQPNAFAETRKQRTAMQVPSKVVKDLPDFSDAAIWTWNSGWGVLDAFKGGIIWVAVDIAGLPEAEALQKAKALAAKPLGGTAGTGYVYAVPKIEPPKVAAAPTSPAPPPPPANDAKPAPPVPLSAGNTFSEAVPVSTSQLLREVKEVSVTYEVDPAFSKYMSVTAQQQSITNALASYGIAVRPNAPVTLLVKLNYLPSTIRETTTYTRGPDAIEDYRSHHFFLTLQFFVRAAVWRNGKLHLVAAAPAHASYTFAVHEGGEFYRQVFGDHTARDIRNTFLKYLGECLKDIASDTVIDDVPWAVSAWPEKEKGASHAEFTKLMSSQSAVDKKPTEGLDTVELDLTPDIRDQACKVDPSWRKFWTAEFVRLGWSISQGPPSARLQHLFWCMDQQVVQFGGPAYAWFFDAMYLTEPNVVFQLNNVWVRKRAVLASLFRMATPLYDQVQATSQSYILRSIMEFSSDLIVGTRNVPVGMVPSVPRPTVPTSPGKSPETVRPAPAPRPAEGFGDLIGPGGFIQPPAGYDK